MKRVMILLGMMMLAGMAVAQGRAPGDFYPDSGTGSATNPAYARGLTVYGSVETNDVMIFADRSGSKGRATNFLALVNGLVTDGLGDETAARIAGDAALIASNAAARAAIVAEAGERVAGDTAARTNHVAAVAAEALLRAQGDAASLASARSQLRDFAATGGVYRLAGADWWLTSTNGSVVLWLIEDDPTRVRIVSASGDFNGRPVGTVFVGTSFIVGSRVWEYSTDILQETLDFYELTDSVLGRWAGTGSFPVTLTDTDGATEGSCVFDWAPITNAYPMARAVDVLRRDGTLPMTGDLDMGGHSISNLSANSIYMGDVRLSASAGTVAVDGADVALASQVPAAGWRNDVYWSIGMEERFETISQTIVTTNDDVITYREIAGIGKIDWQITPNILRGFPDGQFGYSVSGTAGTIDQDGLLTMTTAGLVDVTVTNGIVSKTAKVDLYYSSQVEERSCIYGDMPGSTRAAAAAGIDTRLDGGGNGYWLTNTPPSTFARNPSCWAADADLSGVVVSTGTGTPAWHGTLLTSNHIIMAKHAYNGVGSVKRFRGRSGTNYVRTVTAILDPRPGQAAGNIHGDYVFARLNAALPTNDVCVYPVLPANYVTYLPTTMLRVPALIYDQLGNCNVGELTGHSSIGQPADTNRLEYWSLPYGGDSGRPVFLWVGDRLVFLFVLSTSSVGLSAPVTYRAGMAALLATDGAALTELDLSAYTEF